NFQIIWNSSRLITQQMQPDMEIFDRVRDRELLRRFRSGDRDAFADLYRLHSKAVYRFALYVTSDPSQAADMTQDVFVWLVRNPSQYDPARGELGSFLVGVARLLLKRRYREEQRWVPLDETTPAP